MLSQTVSQWFKNPEFEKLPTSTKREAIGNYFDQRVANDEFSQLAAEEQERARNNFVNTHVETFRPEAPSRSFGADLANTVKRAPAGIMEMLLAGVAMHDRLADRVALKGPGLPGGEEESQGFDLKDWATKKAGQLADWKEDKYPLSKESGQGGFRGAVTQGVESAAVSLGSKAPGVAVGFAAGGLPGAVVGYLTGVPLFGAAQYQEAERRYLDSGYGPEEAAAAARKEAYSEMGWEGASDVFELLTLGSGRLLTAAGKQTMKEGLESVLAGSWRQAVKKGAAVTGAEAAGELGNVGTQAEIQRHYEVGTDEFWQAINKQLGPVAVASVIFGGLGGGLHMANISQARKALSEPVADGLDEKEASRQRINRTAAVGEVEKAIKAVSPNLAKQWRTYADQVVANNAPFDLTKPVEEEAGSARQDETMAAAGQDAADNALAEERQKEQSAELERQRLEKRAAALEAERQAAAGEKAFVAALVDEQQQAAAAPPDPAQQPAEELAEQLAPEEMSPAQQMMQGDAARPPAPASSSSPVDGQAMPTAAGESPVLPGANPAADAAFVRQLVDEARQETNGRPEDTAPAPAPVLPEKKNDATATLTGKKSQDQKAKDIQAVFSELAKDGNTTADLYNQAFQALQEGKDIISGVKDPLIARHRKAFDAGLIKTADDLRAAEEAYGKEEAKEATAPPPEQPPAPGGAVSTLTGRQDLPPALQSAIAERKRKKAEEAAERQQEPVDEEKAPAADRELETPYGTIQTDKTAGGAGYRASLPGPDGHGTAIVKNEPLTAWGETEKAAIEKLKGKIAATLTGKKPAGSSDDQENIAQPGDENADEKQGEIMAELGEKISPESPSSPATATLTGKKKPANIAAGGKKSLGLHVIRFPNGKYGYVGSVPDELYFVDGATQEKIKDAKQFGERFGPKRRIFDTEQEAVDFAAGKGYEVDLETKQPAEGHEPPTGETQSGVREKNGVAGDKAGVYSKKEKVADVAGYGSKNKIFTADAAARARDRLRQKLAGRLNSGLDPELLAAAIQVAGFHVEAGARKFAEFTDAMVADLGEAIQPYLAGLYENIRRYPGIDNAGMSSTEEVDNHVPSADGDLERNSQDADAGDGVGEEDVSLAVRGAAKGSGEGGVGADGQRLAQQGDHGVSGRGAAAAGKQSDQRLSRQTGNDGSAAGPAGGEQSQRGGPADEHGAPDERGGNETAADHAAGPLAEHADRLDADYQADPARRRQQQAKANTLPVSFSSIDNIRESLPFLFPEQQDDVLKAEKRFFEADGRGMLFTNGTGTGKAQPLHSLILTPAGWKKMGDIQPGDQVVAVTGESTVVAGVYPQGDKEIFLVKFSDGAEAECCDEHLWVTQTLYERRKSRANSLWNCAKPKIRSLREIRETLSEQHFIPLAAPVEHLSPPPAIPAYILGVLLGDGCTRGGAVMFSVADEEIAEAVVVDLPEKYLLSPVVVKKGKCPTYRITDLAQGRDEAGRFLPHRMMETLRVWGLADCYSYQKFIPDHYLVAKKDDRLSLLQGLMDTDGWIDKKSGSAYFSSSSSRLAENVVDLARSLGGVATLRQKRSSSGRATFTVCLNLPEVFEPFRLKRKADSYRPNTKYPPRRKIVSVESVGWMPAQCISVSHSSALYITDDYVVTHNTYTGLGVARRFFSAGKTDILLVVPKQTKLQDWIDAGANLGLSIRPLKDTKDSGPGLLITTYANFYQNEALQARNHDLVIYDESHFVSAGKDGDQSAAFISAHRSTADHPKYLEDKAKLGDKEWRELGSRIEARVAEILADPKFMAGNKESSRLWQAQSAAWNDFADERREVESRLRQQIAGRTEFARVVFLSATPFAHHKSLLYADKYLFDVDEGQARDATSRGYNDGGNTDRWFMTNLGYRMRYNKLTLPESGVDVGLMERNLHQKLVAAGAVSGRKLDVPFDYSREFVLLDSELGRQIDDGMDIVRGWKDGQENDYFFLPDLARRRYDYHYVNRLLETLKAREAVDRIGQHLELGRKVVVFHDYIEGAPGHPFIFSGFPAEVSQEVDRFNDKYPQYAQLDLRGLQPAIATMTKAFGDRVVLYNGRVPGRQRTENIRRFNEDGSGVDVIVVLRAAGKEGDSLHDVTGKHPRVFMDLGLPYSPPAAIQGEGRIYRVGQQSDAIMEYLVLHTSFEQSAYGSKINTRVRTVENLAMGDAARDLDTAFKEGYLTATEAAPGAGQGKGGKDQDGNFEGMSAFARARTYYYARGKKSQRQKSREGTDYFATPEPVAMKMVEWARPRAGEAGLEPSAGHGAIARFFPGDTSNHFVEPSNVLAGQLAVNASGVFREGTFEELDPHNKYDFIIMNPPFGSGGATAVAHLAKAVKHLRDGGRVVVLVPEGPAADKRLDKFYEEIKGLYLRGRVSLPAVTFERAATKVRTRVLVFDKVLDKDQAALLSGQNNYDLSGAENIEELFARIEHLEMPVRLPAVDQQQRPQTAAMPAAAAADSGAVIIDRAWHKKKNKEIFTATWSKRLDRETYLQVAAIAKKHHGSWSSFTKKMVFEGSREDAEAFAGEAGPLLEEQENASAVMFSRESVQPWPVAGVVSLAFPAGSNIIAIKDSTISNIAERFGREQIEQLLYDNNIAGTVEALTESEGQALLRFKSFESLRAGLAGTGRALLAREDAAEKPAGQIRESVKYGPGRETDDSRALEQAYRAQLENTFGAGFRLERGSITEVSVSGVEAEAAQGLAKEFGRRVVFVHNRRQDLLPYAGAVIPGVDDVIYINANAAKPYLLVLGHELSHRMELDAPHLYRRFREAVMPLARAAAWRRYQDRLQAMKSPAETPFTYAELESEMLADFMGENFMEEEFWQEVAGREPRLFARIMDWVQKFLDQVLALFDKKGKALGETMFADIKAARTAAAQALVDFKKGTAGDDFAARLDEYAAGQLAGTEPLSVGETPDVLRLLGAASLPVVINRRTVDKILHDKHQLPIELLRQLPERIADPIMVFDSATAEGSMVVMTEMEHDGKTVVAAVHLNSRAGRHEVNRVASVYGKDQDGIFSRWVTDGLLRYQQQQKSRQWFQSRGLQLPKEGASDGLSNKKILTEEDLVKFSGDSSGGPVVLAAADTNPVFFSAMQRHLAAKLPGAGSPSSFLSTINSWVTKGQIKAEELQWSGLADWLAGQDPDSHLTRDELLTWLAENNLQVEEVTKGEETDNQPLDDSRELLFATFPGQPPLARVRFNERAAADGKRLLLIEMLQDDKWSLPAMKRMIRWAADHGFDRIGWTAGGQHRTAAINRYVKKWGVTVRPGKLQLRGQVAEIHEVDIPPQMRADALAGFPLFMREPVENSPAAVARDMEEDRTFLNRLFAQRDLGQHLASVKTAALQKELQAMAGPASRRRHVLGFAYSKLKRSADSDLLDMALMVWRDVQADPDKVEAFRAWAAEQLPKAGTAEKIRIKEQLAVLQRMDLLTPAQAEFADRIGELFDQAGVVAQANKVISGFRDNYVRRIWNLPEGRQEDFLSAGPGHGFKVFSTARMQRKFDTILDGWMAGYDLKVKGLTSSYGVYLGELEEILANKDFVRLGYATSDRQGRRLFSTSRSGEYKDYVELEASGFAVWEWAGNTTAEKGPDDDQVLFINSRGRKFFYSQVQSVPELWAVHRLDEGGKPVRRALRLFTRPEKAIVFAETREYATTVKHRPAKDVADAWEKRKLYAPPQLAGLINQATRKDRLFAVIPGAQELLRINASLKSWILLSSFFHHIAGTRSWAFGVDHGWRPKSITDPVSGETLRTAGLNPVRAYKMGVHKIENLHPLIMRGVKNGLTLGNMQDWDESALRQDLGYSRKLARHLGLEAVDKAMDKGSRLRQGMADSLFKRYFAGLKAEAFAVEYVHELQRAKERFERGQGPAPDVDKVAERVARLINEDFGGLHLQRMGRHPTLQKILRLLLLAPDWCVDAKTRAMTKDGWRFYHELSDDDEIMAFDPQTHTLRWSRLKDKYVNQHYAGKMVQIRNVNRHIMMTPEHTCYARNFTTGQYDIVKAKDLQTNHLIPRCAPFPAPVDKTITDNLVRTVGWMVTDGHVKPVRWTRKDGSVGHSGTGKIKQAKPHTVKILKDMGFSCYVDNFVSDHGKFVSRHPAYVFSVPAKTISEMEKLGIKDNNLTWEFLRRLTDEQRQILYDTMMLGDGTGQKRFCGKEKEVFLMTMLQTMMGLPSTFYQQEKNCWRTRWITRGKDISCWGHHNNKREVDYSGTIWCPSVDTGFWLAEREGLMFITGNTESNFRMVSGLIPKANEWISKMVGDMQPTPGMRPHYNRFFAKVLLRTAASTFLLQILLNGWDDSEKFWKEQMSGENFYKFRWLYADISKIYQALGIDLEGKRKVFPLAGHFLDPLKLFDPPRLIKGKGSPIMRAGEALMGGTDWAERPFTGSRDFLATGKTVKDSRYAAKEGPYDRLPATLVNQVINMQPVQVGYFLKWLQGEEDTLSALLLSAGVGVHNAWQPPMTGPVRLADDPVSAEIERLTAAQLLHMGPPSRTVTIGGLPQKMDRPTYDDYVQRSSERVKARLLPLVQSEKWRKYSQEQQAEIVRDVIISSRKKVRGTIKRRTIRAAANK